MKLGVFVAGSSARIQLEGKPGVYLKIFQCTSEFPLPVRCCPISPLLPFHAAAKDMQKRKRTMKILGSSMKDQVHISDKLGK